MENIQQITYWAGKHRLLIRFFVLPVAFYFFGRLGFILGGELHFWGGNVPEEIVYLLTLVMIAAAWFYPKNARQVLHQQYLKIKGLELVVCMASFVLWVHIGQQTVTYFEPTLYPISSAAVSSDFHFAASSAVSSSSASAEEKTVTKSIKQSFFNYFKNATRELKARSILTPKSERMPKALGIVLGALGIGLGIIVLVCGIQCGGASGTVALGVIGGLALIGLGIWALVAAFKPDTSR